MDRELLLAASVAAARSLRANLVRLDGPQDRRRTVLAAGGSDADTVRARDFCFAVGGLLSAGEAQAARDTLDELLERQQPDGQFPRSFPCRPPRGMARHLRKHFLKRSPVSIEENCLTVWAAARYVRAADNIAWAGLALPALERGMAYLSQFLRAGLLHQPAGSDWKNTLSGRSGAFFFTQLLRWQALRSMEELCRLLGRQRAADSWKSGARSCARDAQRHFWDADAGYFLDSLEDRSFPTEANMAAAAWGFADEAQCSLILRTADRRELWTPWGPKAGEAVPLGRKNCLCVASGVAGFHDAFVWPWISALAIGALRRLDKPAMLSELTERVAAMAKGQGGIREVYHPEDGRPVQTRLYHPAAPSSWNSGMLLECFGELLNDLPAAPEKIRIE
ncbi:MAG: hypothetical protein A2X36_14425 [Elusimicrobia bacterium GWA2_69_24]|nr:MAG: hypothetical protein A2X36_14425 [Elusimicrobia bacterium GWA2_69_24]HBL18412.1 hypothetical protein [Elusimicrobiota bacterium]